MSEGFAATICVCLVLLAIFVEQYKKNNHL